MPRRSDDQNLDRWAGVVLLILVFLVFGRTLSHGFFIVDDPGNFTANPYYNAPSLGDFGDFWKRPFLKLYIPVTYSFWSLLAALSHFVHGTVVSSALDPVVFHGACLILHSLNAWLVYRLLRKLVPDFAAVHCLAGAAVFAIHPLQSEAVCWASGMKDLLSTTLAFTALAVWLSPAWQKKRKWIAYFLATLAFALALLAKPGTVVLPLIVLWLNITSLRGSSWRAGWEMFPWLVLAAGSIIWTRHAQPASDLFFTPPWMLRPLVSADSLGFYLSKLLLPWPIVLDYARPPESVIRGTWLAAWGALGILGIWIFLRHRRTRELGVGLGILALAVLPTSGLLPFDLQIDSTVANRYMYLAMLGAAVACAWALGQMPLRWSSILAPALLITLGISSSRQAEHWQSSKSLLEQNLTTIPKSAFCLRSLADTAKDAGNPLEAEELLRRAMTANPRQFSARNNLGVLLSEQGRLTEAIRVLDETTQAFPASAIAWTNLAIARARQGDIPTAMICLSRAATLAPTDGSIDYNRGLAFLATDDRDNALKNFEAAVSKDPKNAFAHNNAGYLLAARGERTRAIAHLRAALRAAPNFAPAQTTLDRLLAEPGTH